MSVSQACKFALAALEQEITTCSNWTSNIAAADCNCVQLDPESVNAYCNFPENDQNVWSKPYLAAIDARMNACLAVNKPVVQRTILTLPDTITNPLAVQTGPLTPACSYVYEAYNQLYRNCGKNADLASINACICTGLFTESLLAYCDLPGNDKSKWFSDYQNGVSTRADSCSKIGMPNTPIPVLTLPDSIPNPLTATPSTVSLTPACNYVLESFNQRYRNCGKGADFTSTHTCICTGLFTESLSAYCDLPGNDKSKWITDYQNGVWTRSDSCSKVGLPVNPIPLLTLPDNIPNPIPVTPPAPTPSLTQACKYVLDAFNQRYRNCGKGADFTSTHTCICNGLFTESLLAYCDH
ncbi:hypothetical protein BCR33DRAFT_815907 [Rhizoclosmatium globosum]|uniref:Uncharacterized protein n=1 Tax=Rhizoclosmatium globosum TaxID=329046 RepID=A0A1Y2CE20_9FUNG|nr:hypothetical protein BCR33DRAFT_815907 [Rhizoclosmatium globosum]|eukprot:ORY45311.1 hypothetical protein BCR33DRAFT_815907 [Rhizoclosmatium globosum]